MLAVAIQAGLAFSGLVGTYVGFPGYSAPAPIQLGMKFHNVSATVGLSGGKLESTTRVKNHSATAGKVQIRVPVSVRRLPETALLMAMSGTWDDKKIDFRSEGQWERHERDDGVLSYDGAVVATVDVRASGEHTLRVSYSHGLSSRYDADLQTFAYDTRFLGQWVGGKIESINVSLKYDKLHSGESAVYMVERTHPKGWQYGIGHGTNQGGAFFGLRDFTVAGSELAKAPLEFTYYTPR
jgi:hypothetical protein